MNNNGTHKLKYCGEGIRISRLANIIKPEEISVDDFSKIDDFTFLNGDGGIKIGKHVHIDSFVSIVGGGELIIGDYTKIGQGTKIITSNNEGTDFEILKDLRSNTKGKIVIGKGASIGNDVVIYPDVKIGAGCTIDNYARVYIDVGD